MTRRRHLSSATISLKVSFSSLQTGGVCCISASLLVLSSPPSWAQLKLSSDSWSTEGREGWGAYYASRQRLEEQTKEDVDGADAPEEQEDGLPVEVLQHPEEEEVKECGGAYTSVRGAKMNVPMPEPQIATPVTNGLLLSKY